MEGVKSMNEKRWKLTPEILSTLRLIRSNCMLCTDCQYCPLESDEERELCVLGDRLPETWHLKRLEAEHDG